MKTIDILSPEINLKNEIEKIWKNHYTNSALDYYSPLAPEDIKRNTILFLSLNPSIAPDSKKNSSEIETYPIDFSGEHKVHAHFKKFFEIAKEANLKEWTFLDLLFVRNGQLEIEKTMKNNPEFIIEQAKLTIQIIKKIAPRLVIICNALAGKIIYKYSTEIKFIPIPENGVYHLDKIPFIIQQSKFLGNPRIKWASKNEKIVIQKNLLLAEIKKILEKTKDWN